MLPFSFAAVLMCILTSNLLIILCTCILRSKTVLIRIGYPLLGGMILAATVRLFLPFEFTFAKTFWMPEPVSDFLAVFLLHHGIRVGSILLSAWDILLFLWFLGGFLSLARFLRLYFLSAARIKEYEAGEHPDAVPVYQEQIDAICRELKKKNNFRLVVLPDIQVPLYFYYKGPCIIFPEELDCSQEELYFILRHEMSHHFHHDMILKYTVALLCVFYWWNPFCRLLKKQCDTVLEMRVDDSLTGRDSDRTVAYLNCLIKAAKKSSLNSREYPMMIPLCGSKPSPILQRCTLLLHNQTPKNLRLSCTLFAFMVVSIFVTSFLCTFNASSSPDHLEEDGWIVPNENNSYAVVHDNGSYDIYLNGDYWETVDSLEYYPDDMPVYERPLKFETNK